MRIVGGHMRGRKLKAPANLALRPTSDRVRESIFNLIGPGVPGRKALDLFAGTGALGIEALSRGCSETVFVERDSRALHIIQENLSRCAVGAGCRVVVRDAMRFLSKLDADAPFDLVLVDPPYRKDMIGKVLELLDALPWLTGEGVVVCESESSLQLPDKIGNLCLLKHRKYGDTAVHIFSQFGTEG
jgi:16S rRNA (guanine966-N2)-methyltransferase